MPACPTSFWQRLCAGPKEAGKVGLAVLMWLLGVPGILVLLYLVFA